MKIEWSGNLLLLSTNYGAAVKIANMPKSATVESLSINEARVTLPETPQSPEKSIEEQKQELVKRIANQFGTSNRIQAIKELRTSAEAEKLFGYVPGLKESKDLIEEALGYVAPTPVLSSKPLSLQGQYGYRDQRLFSLTEIALVKEALKKNPQMRSHEIADTLTSQFPSTAMVIVDDLVEAVRFKSNP